MTELFVSAGKGLVTRFGTGDLIGYTRDPKDPRRPVSREGEVVRLTAMEMRLYGRSYLKAIQDGSLIERNESDYLAWEKRLESEDAARTIEAAPARKQTESPVTEVVKTEAPVRRKGDG